jgi:hypothetical protein
MARPSLGRLLWASNSTRPHHVDGSGAATWPEKMIYSKVSKVSPNPHGKVSDPCIYRPGLRVRSRTSTGANRTPRLCVGSGPLTAGSQDFGTENTQALIRARRGVRSRHVSEPYRIRFCSPLRRSPDATTWHGARDVSQRTEPDVRPLGCAASAFIADKARRLSIPLAGDVSPRHLLSPVHSTGRRCAASTFNETCPFRGQVACLSIPLVGSTPVLPRALRSSLLARYQGSSHSISILHGPRISWRQEIAQALVTPTMYSFCYVPGPRSRGSASLYVPPLSYKREGTRRYKADAQTLKLSSSLKLNTTHRQWSRVLRSGGLNHSKSLCSLVFIDHLADRQNA